MESKKEQKSVQSLFNTTNTITESFKKLKFVTISCIVGMVACAVICVVYSAKSISDVSNKIYVVDQGQAYTATRQNTGVTRADEIKDQSIRLHQFLFSVTPNKDVVTRNVEEALKISDKSVYNYYKDIDEQGFYRRISQTGAIQDIVVDSVRTDIRQYPYPVVTYCTLTLTRPSLMTRYKLVSRCNMVEVNRNPNNIHGLLIERFEVLSNEKVDERKR